MILSALRKDVTDFARNLHLSVVYTDQWGAALRQTMYFFPSPEDPGSNLSANSLHNTLRITSIVNRSKDPTALKQALAYAWDSPPSAWAELLLADPDITSEELCLFAAPIAEAGASLDPLINHKNFSIATLAGLKPGRGLWSAISITNKYKNKGFTPEQYMEMIKASPFLVRSAPLPALVIESLYRAAEAGKDTEGMGDVANNLDCPDHIIEEHIAKMMSGEESDDLRAKGREDKIAKAVVDNLRKRLASGDRDMADNLGVHLSNIANRLDWPRIEALTHIAKEASSDPTLSIAMAKGFTDMSSSSFIPYLGAAAMDSLDSRAFDRLAASVNGSTAPAVAEYIRDHKTKDGIIPDAIMSNMMVEWSTPVRKKFLGIAPLSRAQIERAITEKKLGWNGGDGNGWMAAQPAVDYGLFAKMVENTTGYGSADAASGLIRSRPEFGLRRLEDGVRGNLTLTEAENKILGESYLFPAGVVLAHRPSFVEACFEVGKESVKAGALRRVVSDSDLRAKFAPMLIHHMSSADQFGSDVRDSLENNISALGSKTSKEDLDIAHAIVKKYQSEMDGKSRAPLNNLSDFLGRCVKRYDVINHSGAKRLLEAHPDISDIVETAVSEDSKLHPTEPGESKTIDRGLIAFMRPQFVHDHYTSTLGKKGGIGVEGFKSISKYNPSAVSNEDWKRAIVGKGIAAEDRIGLLEMSKLPAADYRDMWDAQAHSPTVRALMRKPSARFSVYKRGNWTRAEIGNFHTKEITVKGKASKFDSDLMDKMNHMVRGMDPDKNYYGPDAKQVTATDYNGDLVPDKTTPNLSLPTHEFHNGNNPVFPKFDLSKLRHAANEIEKRNPATKSMHEKELNKLVPGDWKKFKDQQGQISVDAINNHINSVEPNVKYNINHSTWRDGGWDTPHHSLPDGTPDWNRYIGIQRHNDEKQKVFAINLSTPLVDKLVEAGLWRSFKKMHKASRDTHGGVHPVQPEIGLGWVRWTGKPKEGVFIDEIQADLYQDLMNEELRNEAGVSAEDAKKISSIVYGGKHGNVATMESFTDWLRNNHRGTKVAMHSLDSKARMSVPNYTATKDPDAMMMEWDEDPEDHQRVPRRGPNGPIYILDAQGNKQPDLMVRQGLSGVPAPVWAKTTYEEMPRKMGMTKGKYDKEVMPTMNNPHFQGRETWETIVKHEVIRVLGKMEKGIPLSEVETSLLQMLTRR